ncbi:MAG TPA: hypothetical protein VNI57_01525 [Candidatus Saccharimonadales bacterium]|nr:hypothetical protein [Candidatus Saccharimonadales bacterium]
MSHVKVLSGNVEDVSSLEAWRRSFIDGTRDDETRGLMVWYSMVKLVFNGFPPLEYIHPDAMVVDPIKLMNVYGYTFCGPHAASTIALARQAGLEARGWAISGHIVPEILWDGGWHMLDSSLVNWFPREDGSPAGVEEIVREVTAWLDAHPGTAGNKERLMQIQRAGGATGWKQGPALLARTPFLNASGWYPARTHNWATTMLEYDGSTLTQGYEMSASLGYQVNNQLRPGERITFNWGNRGLDVNMHESRFRNDASLRMGEGIAAYTPAFGDLAPGRIGNGTLEWDLPLGEDLLPAVALRAEGLRYEKGEGGRRVVAASAGAPGLIELRVPSSYVYLTGRVDLDVMAGDGASVTVLFSRNQGLDWKEVGRFDESGSRRIDLSNEVLRLYDYRLRIVLQGEGAGLEGLRIHHDFQHSQRALPALAPGENTVRFTAGPAEGTLTLEGNLNAEERSRQVTWEEYHPRVEGFSQEKRWSLTGRAGSIQVPVETPGEMVRIRLSAAARLRGEGDILEPAVSWDGGESFVPLGQCRGPHVEFTCTFTSPPPPPETRKALVRIQARKANAVRLNILRIDADYVEPSGGFRPVRITYTWEEAGVLRHASHVARVPDERYTVTVGDDARMKSLSLELDGSDPR